MPEFELRIIQLETELILLSYNDQVLAHTLRDLVAANFVDRKAVRLYLDTNAQETFQGDLRANLAAKYGLKQNVVDETAISAYLTIWDRVRLSREESI